MIASCLLLKVFLYLIKIKIRLTWWLSGGPFIQQVGSRIYPAGQLMLASFPLLTAVILSQNAISFLFCFTVDQPYDGWSFTYFGYINE